MYTPSSCIADSLGFRCTDKSYRLSAMESVREVYIISNYLYLRSAASMSTILTRGFIFSQFAILHGRLQNFCHGLFCGKGLLHSSQFLSEFFLDINPSLLNRVENHIALDAVAGMAGRDEVSACVILGVGERHEVIPDYPKRGRSAPWTHTKLALTVKASPILRFKDFFLLCLVRLKPSVERFRHSLESLYILGFRRPITARELTAHDKRCMVAVWASAAPNCDVSVKG